MDKPNTHVHRTMELKMAIMLRREIEYCQSIKNAENISDIINECLMYGNITDLDYGWLTSELEKKVKELNTSNHKED